MNYSYVITDRDGELWTGAGWAEGKNFGEAARFSTLIGASRALSRTAQNMYQSEWTRRGPLMICKYRPVRKKRK